MPRYRVMAEQTQLYELYVDADNADEAISIAHNTDVSKFELFNSMPFEDDWQILGSMTEEMNDE